MAKGVFMAGITPAYDDLPEVRYHFPKRYLQLAGKCVNDWILYYEPRQNRGRMVYFATAKVTEIRPDPKRPDHFYAYVSDFLEFPSPVPYKENEATFESALQKDDGSINKGVLGWAIHHIPEREYVTILKRGMRETLDADLPWVHGDAPIYGRDRIPQIITRPYRERAFAKVVQTAYSSTCALTGLRLVNGGGHCEIESAHIRAVEDDGPDSVRNGVALSRTVHWMFDHGILSMEDNGKILIARKLMPKPILSILNSDGYARLPSEAALRPHPQFLRFHRERFKG